MKQKIALKDKLHLENKYITVEPLLITTKRQEAEIRCLLHPAQAHLGYFLA
jgi:hypothetical protein